jgi:hypothetical protein
VIARFWGDSYAWGVDAQALLHRVSRRPCLLSVAGVLLVLLDVRAGFFDLLPDAPGYAAVAFAATRPALAGQRDGPQRRAFAAALVGLASAVPELVSIGWTYHPGPRLFVGGWWSVNTFGRLLALAGSAATAVLLASLCGLVSHLADRHGLHDLAGHARRARPWVAAAVGLDALVALVVLLGGGGPPELAGALVALGVYAAFAVVVVLLAWLDRVVRAPLGPRQAARCGPGGPAAPVGTAAAACPRACRASPGASATSCPSGACAAWTRRW